MKVIATSILLISSTSALRLRGEPLTENCACGICPGEDPASITCTAIMPCSKTDFAKECTRRAILKTNGFPLSGPGPVIPGGSSLLQASPDVMYGSNCNTWTPCPSGQLRCDKDMQAAGVNCAECACVDVKDVVAALPLDPGLVIPDGSSLLQASPDALDGSNCNTWAPCSSGQLRCDKDLQAAGVNCAECACVDVNDVVAALKTSFPPALGLGPVMPSSGPKGKATFPPLGPGPVIFPPEGGNTATCGCICPGPGIHCMAIYKCTPEERELQLSKCPKPDSKVGAALLQKPPSDPATTYCLGGGVGPLLQCERFGEDYVKIQYETCYQYECRKKE